MNNFMLFSSNPKQRLFFLSKILRCII